MHRLPQKLLNYMNIKKNKKRVTNSLFEWVKIKTRLNVKYAYDCAIHAAQMVTSSTVD